MKDRKLKLTLKQRLTHPATVFAGLAGLHGVAGTLHLPGTAGFVGLAVGLACGYLAHAFWNVPKDQFGDG